MYAYAENAPPPWTHQQRGFEATRDCEYAALFMEQRTGKSRVVVDTAAYAYEQGRIDGVLILAPNGVHANWAREAFGQFLPERLASMSFVWRAKDASTIASKEKLSELLSFDGLAILSMNYDAIRTVKGKKYLAKFLRRRKLLIVADEADDLSKPGSKQTITALAAAKWGYMRRVLTGTPAAEGPFSLYSITNFLKPKLLGFDSPLAFKHHHAEWDVDYDGKNDCVFETIARDDDGKPKFLHLDELNAKLRQFSFFCTRAECGAQLPSLVERRFVMAPVQREHYDNLRKVFKTEIAEGLVSARNVLVRYARLQQISSGYVALDRLPETCKACEGLGGLADCPACDGLGIVLGEAVIAELPNPRLDALVTELRGVQGAAVVWTRFRYDADVIIPRLEAEGGRVARFDGATPATERESILLAFQRGEIHRLVASPQAGGRGVDFSFARTDVYYSHYYSLRMRLQSQDRIETLKRTDPVIHVNIVADDSVDELIMAAHVNKRSVQDEIMARPKEEWL